MRLAALRIGDHQAGGSRSVEGIAHLFGGEGFQTLGLLLGCLTNPAHVVQVFDGALRDLPGDELACQGDVEHQMRQLTGGFREPGLGPDDDIVEGGHGFMVRGSLFVVRGNIA